MEEVPMGKIEDTLKGEIARLARKETRAAVGAATTEIRRLKMRVSELNQTVDLLSRTVKLNTRLLQAQSPQLTVSKEEAKRSRLSPGLIKKLRKRLGISQAELASLVDVSAVAIQFWESGRTQPNEENRQAVLALRKHGRRDVQALLAEKAAGRSSRGKKKGNRSV